MDEKISIQLNSIKKGLARGRETYDIFLQDINVDIDGKSIEDWRKEFWIEIPSNLSPGSLKELDTKLMALLQEASFRHALAEARKQLIQHGNDAAFNSKYSELYKTSSSDKKGPAASTLESLARDFNEDIESANLYADVACKFWKNILEYLGTCRKLIENASLNISVELKALNNEHIIDSINRRSGVYQNGNK